jgi:phosphoesterase RecJ-like protein
LLAALAGLRRTIVVGHVTPDADCLASMLAVAKAWPGDRDRGTRVCLPVGSVAHRLQFLVDWADVPVVGPEALPGADGFVVVDNARMSRCNVGAGTPESWSNGRVVINIDHHRTNAGYGTVNWVVPEATSSAELVYHAIRAADRPMTSLIASLLYAGLHSDTRGFLVADPGGRALSVAAELARAGARVSEIGQHLYRGLRPCELELLRVVYANTRVTPDGRIAYATADNREIAAAGCRAEDIDEHVEVPRSVGGIALAVLLTEGTPGRVRVNLRAEPGYTVLPLAQRLGGGGHAQAAGVVLEGTISDAVGTVLPAAKEFLASNESTLG